MSIEELEFLYLDSILLKVKDLFWVNIIFKCDASHILEQLL